MPKSKQKTEKSQAKTPQIAQTKHTKKTKRKGVEPITKKRKTLLKKVNKLPIRKGLYTWLDTEGNPIYIGKSNNIRKRAKQHLIKGKSTKNVDKFAEKAQTPAFKYVQQPGYLDKLEKIAVRTYKPSYNNNNFY